MAYSLDISVFLGRFNLSVLLATTSGHRVNLHNNDGNAAATGVFLVAHTRTTPRCRVRCNLLAAECPALVKPADVHFMLINLDQSKNRRRKMRAEFIKRGLPMFERVPGVLVTEVGLCEQGGCVRCGRSHVGPVARTYAEPGSNP